MSCGFTPTVTISLEQYEILQQYRDKCFQQTDEIAVWMERYKEAQKMLDEQEEELSRLKQLESWLGERFDSDD